MMRVSSNSLSAIFSKADGNRSQVVFNTNEIKEAITYYNLFFGGQAFKMVDPRSPLVPVGETTRLTRALYFFASGAGSLESSGEGRLLLHLL